MKVSVIVPVYNTARYLRICLQSLKEQTLEEVEVICVNDGSTDDSYEIIQQFVAEDSRFKAIHKSNTGYGHSVNMGIRAAQSPYIGIVESDDFAEPGMFQKLYEAAERNKADYVKGNYHIYREDSSCSVVFEEMLGAFPYEQVFSPREEPKVFGIHPSVWTSLYRKQFLEEHDIWFLETPGASYQDIGFAFKVNASAKRVSLIKDAVLNYRVDNVDSSVHNPQKLFCVCNELKEIERYIAKRANVEAFETEWLNELYQIAAWIKYRNYMWNYMRLAMPYQYAFLLRVQEELKEVRQQGYESGVWGIGEKETLEQMAEAPDEFFQITGKGYEDSRLSMIPVQNHLCSVRCFCDLVAESREIYLYGAGHIGQQVLGCLKQMDAGCKVRGFIVSELGDHPGQQDGKPIFAFSEIQKQDNTDALVLVAVHRRYQYELALKLHRGGYRQILLIDEQIKTWMLRDKRWKE